MLFQILDTGDNSINNNSVLHRLQSIKTFFKNNYRTVKKSVIRKKVKKQSRTTVATGDENETKNVKEDFIKNIKDIITEMMVVMIDVSFEGNTIFNDMDNSVNEGDKVINNLQEAVNNEHQAVNNGDKATNNVEETINNVHQAVNNGHKVLNDGDKATNNANKISFWTNDGQFIKRCKDIESHVTTINRLKFMEEYLYQTCT